MFIQYNSKSQSIPTQATTKEVTMMNARISPFVQNLRQSHKADLRDEIGFKKSLRKYPPITKRKWKIKGKSIDSTNIDELGNVKNVGAMSKGDKSKENKVKKTYPFKPKQFSELKRRITSTSTNRRAALEKKLIAYSKIKANSRECRSNLIEESHGKGITNIYNPKNVNESNLLKHTVNLDLKTNSIDNNGTVEDLSHKTNEKKTSDSYGKLHVALEDKKKSKKKKKAKKQRNLKMILQEENMDTKEVHELISVNVLLDDKNTDSNRKYEMTKENTDLIKIPLKANDREHMVPKYNTQNTILKPPHIQSETKQVAGCCIGNKTLRHKLGKVPELRSTLAFEGALLDNVKLLSDGKENKTLLVSNSKCQKDAACDHDITQTCDHSINTILEEKDTSKKSSSTPLKMDSANSKNIAKEKISIYLRVRSTKNGKIDINAQHKQKINLYGKEDVFISSAEMKTHTSDSCSSCCQTSICSKEKYNSTKLAHPLIENTECKIEYKCSKPTVDSVVSTHSNEIENKINIRKSIRSKEDKNTHDDFEDNERKYEQDNRKDEILNESQLFPPSCPVFSSHSNEMENKINIHKSISFIIPRSKEDKNTHNDFEDNKRKYEQENGKDDILNESQLFPPSCPVLSSHSNKIENKVNIHKSKSYLTSRSKENEHIHDDVENIENKYEEENRKDEISSTNSINAKNNGENKDAETSIGTVDNTVRKIEMDEMHSRCTKLKITADSKEDIVRVNNDSPGKVENFDSNERVITIYHFNPEGVIDFPRAAKRGTIINKKSRLNEKSNTRLNKISLTIVDKNEETRNNIGNNVIDSNNLQLHHDDYLDLENRRTAKIMNLNNASQPSSKPKSHPLLEKKPTYRQFRMNPYSTKICNSCSTSISTNIEKDETRIDRKKRRRICGYLRSYIKNIAQVGMNERNVKQNCGKCT